MSLYIGQHKAKVVHIGEDMIKRVYLGNAIVYQYDLDVSATLVGCSATLPSKVYYGEPLVAALVPDTGYQQLPWNTKVTMGGEDITSAAYDAATNSINITEVTGDISIEAEAVEMSSDYKPLEYISTRARVSGNRINLPYHANSNTKLVMDVKLNENALAVLYAGSTDGTAPSASAPNYFFYFRNTLVSNWKLAHGSEASSGTTTTTIMIANERVVFINDRGNFKYKTESGSTRDVTISGGTWSLDNTYLGIMAMSATSSASNYGYTCVGNLYGVEISEPSGDNANMLLRYYPVVRLSDGAVGIYDTVNGNAIIHSGYIAPYIAPTGSYTNCAATLLSDATTGATSKAVIGSTWSIKITPSSGYTFDNKRAVADSAFQVVVNNVDVTNEVATYDARNDEWTITLVPNENDSISIVATAQEAYYDAELEYLQTDGAAYIDTGLYRSVDGREYLLECRIDDYQETSYVGGTTQGNAYARSRLYLFVYNSTSDTFQFILGNKLVAAAAEHNSAVHEVLFNTQGLGVYLDGSKIGDFSSNGYTAYFLQPIRLFSLKYHRTSSDPTYYYSKSSIYRFKSITKSGRVVEGDFIPVRKNGVGYMFNNITKTLFGNANETGAFICGPDRLPYVPIESTLTNVVCTRLSLPITGNSEKAVIGQTLVLKYVPMDGYYFVEGETTPVITFDGVDVSSDTSKVTITYNSADNSYTLTILNVPDCAIGIGATAYDIIQFEDDAVKAICVENWGGNVVNGEITKTEAAAVTSLGEVFRNNTDITKFNELQYFTGLNTLRVAFYNCSNLTEITFPAAYLSDTDSPNERLYLAVYGTKVVNVDLSPLTTNATRQSLVVCQAVTTIKEIVFPACNVNTLYYAFQNCSSLEKIDFSLCDFADLPSAVNNRSTTAGMVNATTKINTIVGGFPNLKRSIAINVCPLTVESAITVVTSLSSSPVSGATLSLKNSMKTTYQANSDFNAAVATATANGWTIAYS